MPKKSGSDIKAIMFDLDGTLVNSMGHFTRIAAEVLARFYGVSRRQAQHLYTTTSGLPFLMQLEVLYPGCAHNAEAAANFEGIKRQSYLEQKFFTDIDENLVCLKQQGIKLIVSSNNHQENVEMILATRQHLFDAIFGFRPGFMKVREHLQEVQQIFTLAASQILFVGDSLHDAGEAARFGLAFVGRLGTYDRESFKNSYPQFPVIEHLGGLISLLFQLPEQERQEKDQGRGYHATHADDRHHPDAG